MLISYAVLLTEKKDEEGQSQVLSAALEVRLFHYIPKHLRRASFFLSSPIDLVLLLKINKFNCDNWSFISLHFLYGMDGS